MKRSRLTVLIPVGALLVACGADGPDTESVGPTDLGIEVVGGGDISHEMHDEDLSGGEAMSHDAGAMSDASSHSEMAVPGSDVDDMLHEDERHEEAGSADATDADANDEDAHMASGAGEIVVNVEMVEFGFVADVDVVPLGEPVIFRFSNTGVVPHEAMFGSHHQQDEFASSAGHGEHGADGHHGDVAAITLDPGASGEMTLEFSEAGEVWIGCHLPGHFDAGMAASFAVA